jgi:hypothetical protein
MFSALFFVATKFMGGDQLDGIENTAQLKTKCYQCLQFRIGIGTLHILEKKPTKESRMCRANSFDFAARSFFGESTPNGVVLPAQR